MVFRPSASRAKRRQFHTSERRMTRESAVKKRAAIRKFKNGTQHWVDHHDQLYCAAEKEWATDLEKSKHKFSPFAAEKYLNGGMDVLEHFAGRVMRPSPGGLIGSIDDLNHLRRVIARHTNRCLSCCAKSQNTASKMRREHSSTSQSFWRVSFIGLCRTGQIACPK
jgi:hypothetical protein